MRCIFLAPYQSDLTINEAKCTFLARWATLADLEKAPDDFKHPSVWIDGKILEVSIPVTIKIDPEPESQKRERNQDYGMSM